MRRWWPAPSLNHAKVEVGSDHQEEMDEEEAEAQALVRHARQTASRSVSIAVKRTTSPRTAGLAAEANTIEREVARGVTEITNGGVEGRLHPHTRPTIEDHRLAHCLRTERAEATTTHHLDIHRGHHMHYDTIRTINEITHLHHRAKATLTITI